MFKSRLRAEDYIVQEDRRNEDYAVIFAVNNRRYALRITNIVQLLTREGIKIVRVKNIKPGYIYGFFYFDEKMIPVFSMEGIFNIDAEIEGIQKGRDKKLSALIVIKENNKLYSYIVDDIIGIINIAEFDAMELSPSFFHNNHPLFINTFYHNEEVILLVVSEGLIEQKILNNTKIFSKNLEQYVTLPCKC